MMINDQQAVVEKQSTQLLVYKYQYSNVECTCSVTSKNPESHIYLSMKVQLYWHENTPLSIKS